MIPRKLVELHAGKIHDPVKRLQYLRQKFRPAADPVPKRRAGEKGRLWPSRCYSPVL